MEKLKQRDLIEPGTGAWSSPVVLVKKSDGSCRFCANYRHLNAEIKDEVCPLPPVKEGLKTLVGNH